MGTGPDVALFISGADWHARRLVKALRAAGAAVTRTSLTRCRFSTTHPAGLDIPGFPDRLPDAVFVRTIDAGSFEAVTLRLGLLHALAEAGVPVWNAPRAIEACVDKAQTTWRLQRAGLPTPDTWALESHEAALVLVAAEATPERPLVLKPLFGSQGKALRLVAGPDGLPPPETVSGVYYLQRFVGRRSPDLSAGAAGFHDHRVLVAGGRALAGMTRRGTGWITNIKQGATAEAWVPDAEAERLAVAAAAAVGADYAGVDLIADGEGGYLVLEVNSMPAWSGLQTVTGFDLTDAMTDAFLTDVAARTGHGRAPLRAVGP
jgi:tetrahydromethanopterin:alpha-L-glutamate ligase